MKTISKNIYLLVLTLAFISCAASPANYDSSHEGEQAIENLITAEGLQLEYATFPSSYIVEGWEDDFEFTNQVVEGGKATGFLADDLYVQIAAGQLSALTKTGFRVEIAGHGILASGLSLTTNHCAAGKFPDGTSYQDALQITDDVSGITLTVDPLGILFTAPGERVYFFADADAIEFGGESYKNIWSLPEVDDEVVVGFSAFNLKSGEGSCGIKAGAVTINLYSPNGLGQANALQAGPVEINSIQASEVALNLPADIDATLMSVLGETTGGKASASGAGPDVTLTDVTTAALTIDTADAETLYKSGPSFTIEDSKLDSMSFVGDAKALNWMGTSMATPMVLSGTIDKMTVKCSDVTVGQYQKGEILNTITYPCDANY